MYNVVPGCSASGMPTGDAKNCWMLSKTGARVRHCAFVAISFCFAARTPLACQSVLLPQDLPNANNVLEKTPARKSLPCDMFIQKYPRLDYQYRYSTGFRLVCSFGIIQTGETLLTLIRIKPEKRDPVLMTERFEVPRLPPEKLNRFYSVPLSQIQITMGGGFALGPGRYSVEILLIDHHGHSCRVVQSLTAGIEKKERILSALRPGAVAPLVGGNWNGKLVSSGLRVTVLLHADNPGGGPLAYPPVYWLQYLTAVLDHIRVGP
jgi:hypothetical protein